MNKVLLSGMLLAAACAAATNVQAETLTLPWTAGYSVGLSGANACMQSERGAVRALNGSCHWMMPLTVPVGRRINQVKIHYGEELGALDPVPAVTVSLQYKIMGPGQDQWWDWREIKGWSNTNSMVTNQIAVENLLHQTGIPPILKYWEDFLVAPYTGYRVEVEVQDQSEFFGLSVIYEYQ